MALRDEILSRFSLYLADTVKGGQRELIEQGHRASGRGVASLRYEIDSTAPNRITGNIYGVGYLAIVDSGVPASRIPFSGSRGSGGTSAYIRGLIDWIADIRPGMDFERRRSFAFAIAHTHKREGMPSRGSFSFSSNGRRTGWIQYGLKNQAQYLKNELALLELLVRSYRKAIKSAA